MISLKLNITYIITPVTHKRDRQKVSLAIHAITDFKLINYKVQHLAGSAGGYSGLRVVQI